MISSRNTRPKWCSATPKTWLPPSRVPPREWAEHNSVSVQPPKMEKFSMRRAVLMSLSSLRQTAINLQSPFVLKQRKIMVVHPLIENDSKIVSKDSLRSLISREAKSWSLSMIISSSSSSSSKRRNRLKLKKRKNSRKSKKLLKWSQSQLCKKRQKKQKQMILRKLQMWKWVCLLQLGMLLAD